MAYSSAAVQVARRAALDPRTKFALVIVLALIVLGGFGGEQVQPLRVALSVLPFVLLLLARQWGRFARGLVMLSVGYGLLLLMPHLPASFGFLALFCGGVLTRFVVTVVMGEYLIGTTSVSEFIAAMERMHMPQAVTIPFSVMFRFFPTVVEEWRSIRRAMGMRGIRLGGAKAGQVIEYQVVPMIFSSVRIADELSAAALTRGLGAPTPRTNICQIGLRVRDWLLLGVCAVSIGASALSTCGVFS